MLGDSVFVLFLMFVIIVFIIQFLNNTIFNFPAITLTFKNPSVDSGNSHFPVISPGLLVFIVPTTTVVVELHQILQSYSLRCVQ